jgi:hypothetical protein
MLLSALVMEKDCWPYAVPLLICAAEWKWTHYDLHALMCTMAGVALSMGFELRKVATWAPLLTWVVCVRYKV